MMKISKYILLILFLLNLNHQVQAKPVPPGSGEGDVPANILLLIDSSASMKRMLNNRDATESIGGLVYDTSGNIVMSQRRSLAVVRFDSEGNKVTRIVGDNYQIVAGSEYVNVKGTVHLTIDSNCPLLNVL